MKKKVIGLVVDPEIYHKFKVKVVSEGKTVSKTVEELMQRYINE